MSCLWFICHSWWQQCSLWCNMSSQCVSCSSDNPCCPSSHIHGTWVFMFSERSSQWFDSSVEWEWETRVVVAQESSWAWAFSSICVWLIRGDSCRKSKLSLVTFMQLKIHAAHCLHDEHLIQVEIVNIFKIRNDLYPKIASTSCGMCWRCSGNHISLIVAVTGCRMKLVWLVFAGC